VDALLSLRDRDHAGPLTMVSSHGLLPESHARDVLSKRAPAIEPHRPPSVRGLVRALRRDAAVAEDWRQTVDGVRPITVATWRALAMDERRRALRHVFRRWEVRRHRMAPEVAAVVEQQHRTGRLTMVRGRVLGVEAAAGELHVLVDADGTHRFAVDAVIACIGPSADPLHDPLLASALVDGVVARHPLGLGLDVDDVGRARRPDGTVHPHLWTTGSLRKGAEWESTAVPELRVHARDLAEAIGSAG
jgi:uncharacterized NAD(P)/FAD-binding protein YdhS